MRNCRHCKKLIHDSLNGTLTEKKSEYLNKHISICGSCKQYNESMLSMSKSLKALNVGYEIDVKNDVLSQIANLQPVKKKVHYDTYLRNAVALATVVLIIGVYMFSARFNSMIKQNQTEGFRNASKSMDIDSTTYGIASLETQPSNNGSCAVTLRDSLIDENNLPMFGYKTSKSLTDFLEEVESVAEQYDIIQISSNEPDKELSFVSFFSNLTVLENKFNLKKDDSFQTLESQKHNEGITDQKNEYVLFIIKYSK